MSKSDTAFGGGDEIDCDLSPGEGQALRVIYRRHRLLQTRCGCGHLTQAVAPRADVPLEWQEAAAQQLVGPGLASIMVLLSLRYHLSRVKVRELLTELLGAELSLGLIDQTIRKTAGKLAPMEDATVAKLEQAAQLHVDETVMTGAGIELAAAVDICDAADGVVPDWWAGTGDF